MVFFSNLSRGFLSMFGKNNWFSRFRSYLIGQVGAVWIDTSQPWKIYHENSQVRTIYDRFSAMFSNMEIYKEDKTTGERVDDPKLQSLLNQPNATQTQNEFLKQYITQLNVYGNQFMYSNRASVLQDYPTALRLISPLYMRPYLTGKVFDQVDMKDIISHYEYTDNRNFMQVYETDTILYTKLPGLDDPIIGVSKLSGYKFPISNTEAAYEYLNVISTKRGAIGIITNESQDSSGGGVPMDPKERKEMEDQYTNDYGIGKGKSTIKISDAKLRYQSVSYPTRDLLLLEQIDANALVIMDSLGLNANIFSSKSATYENVKNGMILSYQDAIQPAADLFVQALGPFINEKEFGVNGRYRLCASYKHLQILAGDEKEKADTMAKQFQTVRELVQAGLVSNDTAYGLIRELTGVTIENKNVDIVDLLNRLSPLVANNVLQQLTINQVRSILNLPAIADGDRLVSEIRLEQQAAAAQLQNGGK